MLRLELHIFYPWRLAISIYQRVVFSAELKRWVAYEPPVATIPPVEPPVQRALDAAPAMCNRASERQIRKRKNSSVADDWVIL